MTCGGRNKAEFIASLIFGANTHTGRNRVPCQVIAVVCANCRKEATQQQPATGTDYHFHPSTGVKSIRIECLGLQVDENGRVDLSFFFLLFLFFSSPLLLGIVIGMARKSIRRSKKRKINEEGMH